MDFNGSSWVFIRFYESLRVLTGPYIMLCVCMVSNASFCVLMGPYRFLCVLISPNVSLSVFKSFLSSLWFLMGPYEYL